MITKIPASITRYELNMNDRYTLNTLNKYQGPIMVIAVDITSVVGHVASFFKVVVKKRVWTVKRVGS